MSRKLTKGYYVHGKFVAEGSELDIQLKAELKGTDASSRTDLKKESDELQALGESLLTLRLDLFTKLQLGEKLHDAIVEAKRISNFEGKRRQMQYIGKLMRKQEPEMLDAMREALKVQRTGSAQESLALHKAETWRNSLIAEDGSFQEWMEAFPGTDSQQLRALIRQARKDATPEKPGALPRHGRAYRDIFQLVREHLADTDGPLNDGAIDESHQADEE
ncbi:ribosome biogenesis factor YjgA [Rhodoferax sp.]|uniref:ribosome biogenesis factor YjgA n=1 Tax=Rhodoferax sp. TaxID=50421 RepID=UPI00374D792C